MRRRAKPAKAKVKADLAATYKSLKSDGSKVRDLEKRLAEALEQQTATAERFHLPAALDNAKTLVRERATRHGIMLTQTVDPGVGTSSRTSGR